MEIDARTQFCGVIGNPVDHSLSPAIHNAAFRKLGLNFVYLAWRVESIADAICGLKALGNFRGASVTIPHKVAALPLLDEVEATAKHIGAINTIVAREGRLTGYNTDASGALRALREAGTTPKHGRVSILGTGGAARAIAFALATDGQLDHLYLFGIVEQERDALARDLRAKTSLKLTTAHLDDAALEKSLADSQLLIHCTPVGMSPKVDESCVPRSLLHSSLTVMDVVYNPRETRLLKDARQQGCRTISGLEMFLYQAAGQFELWTGKPAPTDTMRAILESRFS
ncbi:MAG TPA: shikimate dehydrogenase [Nitrospira sp.]|nr:shikimate dehydrogenase [Nitrospira sp.]